MVKRRSLDDALTPEQEQFLRGKERTPAPSARPKKKTTNPEPEKKTKQETPAMNKPALKEFPSEPAAIIERRTLPTLVGLNTRIEDHLSDGLLRATMDRRLRRLPLSKVQDIVGEALRDWLKKNDYMN